MRHCQTCYSQTKKTCFVISVSDNLGCSDHNIVELEIQLCTLKVSIKTKVLDFRRGNFSLLRAQLGGIPWEASTEDKGASEGREFFQEHFPGSTKAIHRL